MQLYEVGGKVRDDLLKLPSRDVDYAYVSTTQSSAAEAFAEMRDWVEAKGLQIFQELPATWTIRAKPLQSKQGSDFVLAVQRNGEIIRPGTIADDLAARDFTINAIARATDGILIDPFGGQQDLTDRCLRTPIDPVITLQHDPIRALRAVRFAVKLGFTWCPELETALHHPDLPFWMDRVDRDRLLQELLKTFKVDTWGVLKRLHSLPEPLVRNWLERPGLWLMPTTRQK